MSTFDTKVGEATQNDSQSILGFVAIAIDSTGKEIVTKATGKTHLNDQLAKPMTQDSVFRLASCTKLITSIAILRLVQAGKLDLDDPDIIAKTLPEFMDLEVMTSAPGAAFTYVKRNSTITPRRLLTHTSGIGADFLDPRLQAWRQSRGEPPLALSGDIVKGYSTPLLYQPGEGWAYGGGLDLSSLLISRITGTSFGEFLRNEIFDVVGCDAGIGFGATKFGDVLAQTVTRGPEGELKEWPAPDVTAEMGGGSLLCSARNYVKILADLISPTPKLLNPDMIDALFTGQLQEGSASLNDLRQAAPIFTAMTGALTSDLPPASFNHGLGGMLVTEDSPGLGKTAGMLTWGGAFSCLWFASRKAGIAGFYGTSIFPPGDVTTGDLMSNFIREAWEKIGEKKA